MRVRASEPGGLSVHAIAGPHVVLLGLDMRRPQTRGLLGFAVERTDPVEDERYWLRGFRVFRSNADGVRPGQSVSLREHPLQSFLWGDYTVKPGRPYRYRVVALYGKPKHLEPRAEVTVEVTTEATDDGVHGIHFNRGVAGSQAYNRQFGRPPRDGDRSDPAYDWLGRGLDQAILDFVGRAKGARFGLRAAVYEFAYPYVLDALRAAADTGADVRIIYDRRGAAPTRGGKRRVWQSSEPAIRKAGIGDLVIPRRTNNAIAHNKFIVLTEDGAPTAVWTGSTNITWGGIFGQSNVGHEVRDPAVAAAYLDYWQRLQPDPAFAAIRPANMQACPDPPDRLRKGVTPIFSPRGDLGLIDWYADQARRAKRSFFMTSAFGVHPKIADAIRPQSNVLRYLVLEKEDTGVRFDQDSDVKVAVGSFLKTDILDRWTVERLSGLNNKVKYSHTKFMLIDPLGDDPVVVSGSGNFSDKSVSDNDENMLLIRGDTRVADAYLGEFMAIFNHFYFRYLFQKAQTRAGEDAAYLREDDSWVDRYYDRTRPSYRQRLLFR
jgi:phosphatidylserine/phosphatidylglycerophosphate/cardiolipin synthase-like enzyme